MDFVNQVKKVKDLTRSPKVRELCESFLRGDNISKEELIAQIEKQSHAVPLQESAVPRVPNHVEVKRKEENEVSKRAAAQLMESWGGVKNTTSSNSGTWVAPQETKKEESALLESMDFLGQIDDSARSFADAQKLHNFGIREAIQKIRESSLHSYPKAKIVCDQFTHLLGKGLPEFVLVEGFVNELKQLSWDSEAAKLAENLSAKMKEFSREIEVAKVLETLKNSGNASFYSDLKESLDSWLVSESKSTGLLIKDISKYTFNPVVRNLVNYLKVTESDDSRKLEIPEVAQGESRVAKVYSPVIMESGNSTFHIGGAIFEANTDGIRKLTNKEVSSLDPAFLTTTQILAKPNVKVNESGIFVQLGKKTVRMVEEAENIAVYLGNTKLNFNSLPALGKILGLESASHFGVNESQVVNDILFLFHQVPSIVELDFAKSIVSNLYEGVCVNLIKWNDKILLQRINESMRENSVFDVNGTQAVKMVKDFLRYDISEGLTDFLEGEQKLKSIMVNDRNKVLENISRVESEIGKIATLMESNALYKNSPQIQNAVRILENELLVLREKWNQINLEIKKIDEEEAMKIPQINEDEKFNIGDFVKVKESGETGKIISVDGTSGRYTVLLDNGKTSDFLVNEIADLEEALSQAADKNAEKGEEEEGGEELKEANNLNKSPLSIEEQKTLLKNFANMHGFSKAPRADDNEEIEMELDSLHGYNITMNEGKAKIVKGTPAPDFSEAPGDSKLGKGKDANKGNVVEAPGNDKKTKGKVEGVKSLASTPKGQSKTDFDGEDESGNKYDIGYNLREGKDAELAEAPETGKKAKETKGTTSTNLVEAPESGSGAKETKGKSSSLVKDQNLAEAPGAEGDIDYDVNDEIGYNLTESEAEVKKN